MRKQKSEKTHAKFAASSAYRWQSCPGSIQLSEKAPPQRESEYAREGTEAHEWFETYLRKPAAMKAAKTEMQLTVAESAKWVLSRKEKGHELLTESKVYLEHIHPEMSGTLDAAIVEPFGVLTVIDYKHGAGIAVSPVDNPQLIFYALGAAKAYDYNFTHVELVILQPRSPDNNTIQTHKMEFGELMRWESRFAKAAQDATVKPPILSAGDHCRFCPAASFCPEISVKALSAAKADFAPETGKLTLPSPEAMTPKELSQALVAFDHIEHWINSAREVAFNALQSGGKIPGFKLVEKRAIRKWIDEKKTEIEASKQFGEKAFSLDLLSPAQLEKIVGKEWVALRVQAQSSGLTMAPDTDKRDAVCQIERDFEPVTRT